MVLLSNVLTSVRIKPDVIVVGDSDGKRWGKKFGSGKPPKRIPMCESVELTIICTFECDQRYSALQRFAPDYLEQIFVFNSGTCHISVARRGEEACIAYGGSSLVTVLLPAKQPVTVAVRCRKSSTADYSNLVVYQNGLCIMPDKYCSNSKLSMAASSVGTSMNGVVYSWVLYEKALADREIVAVSEVVQSLAAVGRQAWRYPKLPVSQASESCDSSNDTQAALATAKELGDALELSSDLRCTNIAIHEQLKTVLSEHDTLLSKNAMLQGQLASALSENVTSEQVVALAARLDMVAEQTRSQVSTPLKFVTGTMWLLIVLLVFIVVVWYQYWLNQCMYICPGRKM